MSSAAASAPRTSQAQLQRQRQRQRSRQLAVRLVLLLLALFYALFPIIWIASASFDPRNSLVNLGLIPQGATLDNYETLLNSDIHPFTRWLWNSIKVSTITMVLSVLVSTFAAYAFSRFRFRGRDATLLTVFLIQVFPNSLTIVATFLLIQEIGNYIPSLGLNSHGGLILVYLGGALGINTWLMKGFFDSVPRDLDESAMIDGASDWRIFWQILFPLVRPILAVVGILTFISTYNDVIIALTLLKNTQQQTLAVGLNLFLGEQFSQQWGVFAAGALIGAVPIVVLYLLMQDYIVGGLTAGAVKG
ncbi:MAG TPA: sugar ABC transporter permease [Aggregatilineaceae bacterium]|nr:sugar ABC transporter permease [Anaerolineae bacterium]HMM28472.1 sugar ABC transporter permease [Aggregatilineaceae bacterium]